MLLTDDELVERCLRDDMEAGQEIYLRYALFLYRLAYKITLDKSAAEDLCQEAWLRIFKNMAEYRLGTSFRSWCASICYRLSIDFVRRRQIRDKADPGLVQNRIAQEIPSPHKETEEKEILSKVWSLLQTLPEAGRAAFILRHFDDLSYREIGEIQGCPEKTARTKVFRITQALRRHFQEEDLIEGLT